MLYAVFLFVSRRGAKDTEESLETFNSPANSAPPRERTSIFVIQSQFFPDFSVKRALTEQLLKLNHP